MWKKLTTGDTSSPARDRSERLVWAATGSLGVLFAFLAFRPVPSFEQEFDRLARSERAAISAWQAIITESGVESLTDSKVARRIEHEVLPSWRDARGRIARLQAGPWSARIAPQLSESFRLREEAWIAMVAAARTRDPAQTRRAEAAWVEADRLVAEMRTPAKPP